jgi:predicted DNA-binding transcriptional regulator AlpA
MLQKKKKAVLSKPPGHAERTVARLISKPEVLDRVGVTFPTLWAWMRAGNFPRARILGGRTCWLESEIDAWIENRPIRRLKGDPGGAS